MSRRLGYKQVEASGILRLNHSTLQRRGGDRTAGDHAAKLTHRHQLLTGAHEQKKGSSSTAKQSSVAKGSVGQMLMNELKVTDISTNGDKQKAHAEACKEPYKEVLKMIEKHGIESFVEKLQRKHCQAILTIGFGKHFVGSSMLLARQQDK
eukprot:scaffold48824_cov21-Cyclotella_meneghiniana.AAC.1